MSENSERAKAFFKSRDQKEIDRLRKQHDEHRATITRLKSELAHMRKAAGTDSCADYAERNAELAAENTKLADALDTACNMLETVGSVALTFRAVGCKAGKTRIACENCGNDWDYDNPGNPDAHDAACDIPDVFRVRDEWKAAQERKRLEAELSGETPEPCGTCGGSGEVPNAAFKDTPYLAEACPDCSPLPPPCPACRPHNGEPTDIVDVVEAVMQEQADECPECERPNFRCDCQSEPCHNGEHGNEPEGDTP